MNDESKKELEICDGTMDITDPCYDRNTYCALWAVKVKNGIYEVSTEYIDGYVSEIRAFIPGEKIMDANEIGSVGVDSGLCGFFANKPDFGHGEWRDICAETFKHDEESDDHFYDIRSGIFCQSGYGDGDYPVTAYYNADKEIVGLLITFIFEGDGDYEGDDDE